MAEENLEKKQTKSKAKVETKRKRVAKKEGENVKKTREGVKRTAKSSETKRRTRAVEKESTSIAKRENAKTVKAGKSTTTQRRKTTRNTNKSIFKKSKLKIIPLGGLHEIGKNITVFEYENEIIVVDCGLSFPEDDMLGIDLVIPDITYLEKNVDKIKGLVITHGHEDHIGSIPYFLKQINTPIYATRLAVGLISNKLEEHKLLRSTEMHIVTQGETIQLGKNFKVEFIRSSHSIPDSVMLAITTPAGTILHTGDFKVDYTPIDGQLMDFGRIAELGNKGILALMSDSTNAERKGFTMSESSVGELFDTVFQNCTKRIVVATFASNVHRIQQIVNSAIKYNRKIAVCGRSMINIINTSIELGYIKCPDNIFIDIDMIGTYTDEQLVIITTGSQGEPMSALTRMAAGDHRKITITPNDLIIISATPIPGNEKYVSKVIDDLMQLGAEVVYSALANVHVSGHACQEDQKLIYQRYYEGKTQTEIAKENNISQVKVYRLERKILDDLSDKLCA